MKINLNFFQGVVCVIGLGLLHSCDSDPDPVVPPGEEGFYVVNEGAFGNNNASLSFYDRVTDLVTNDVFHAKNGRVLGDQAQSMTIFQERGYIVVQNSGKVEVIDITDNSSIKTIVDDIESPRYFIGVSSSKGYVSDWGEDGLSGTVKVINLQTLSVAKTISAGKGPNRMLKVGEKVYVANSGGFGKDNTIKVLDINIDEIVNTIEVCDNPNSLQMDKAGNLWVACGGNLVYNQDFSINESLSTTSRLRKIHTTGFSEFPYDYLTYSTLGQLDINPAGDKIYYLFDGALYVMDINSDKLPVQTFVNKSFYGFSVDPFTGDVIGTLAPNFSSAGRIEVYTAAGTAKSNYVVGIAPNGCAFK